MSGRNAMQSDRATAPTRNLGAQNAAQNPPFRDNEVWVKKWVDYSSKYGLGYCLSNEATGVFFNDSTKICLDPNGFHFDYMERRSADRQDVGKEYTLTEYPKELQKKVTLLQHFRSYLEGTEKPNPNAKVPDEVQRRQRRITDVVYVKKWMRTRHAIMFRLSNKVVQVNFQDHTEIMLSSETKVVTYVNKRGERSTYPLNSAMESANLEMVKRLKYTKDILTHMLNQNAGNLRNNQVKSASNQQRQDGAQEPALEGAGIGGAGVQSSRPPQIDLPGGGIAGSTPGFSGQMQSSRQVNPPANF